LSTLTTARDAATHNDEGLPVIVPAPWYARSGRAAPKDIFKDANSEKYHEAHIFDRPFIQLRPWGNQPQKKNPLYQVTAEGIFHIWLVVKSSRGDTSTAKAGELSSQGNALQLEENTYQHDNDVYHFLYHISLEFNRKWIWNQQGWKGTDDFEDKTKDPHNSHRWKAETFQGDKWNQRIIAMGKGKGNGTPVFSGEIANDQMKQKIKGWNFLNA
jgi:hypothetical protein